MEGNAFTLAWRAHRAAHSETLFSKCATLTKAESLPQR
jgi:hypothetical protein